MAHGHLPPALVGYGWPFLTMPLAGIAGANYLDGLPALVLLETLVFVPLGLLAVYGIASRIGGRWLGYVSAACWILIPYVAIPLSAASYREAYEQQLLPQALGLIGDGALPGTICVLVAAYFAVSSLDTADRVQAASRASSPASQSHSTLRTCSSSPRRRSATDLRDAAGRPSCSRSP